ncbi:helix-turn-helix transcriptional regulator [Pedobacter jamesrossensis]|uniref:Helix-turn-helix transcriptional regulator n=1 Tax=Pedobacter jamesrossensis TaxID=1908238 RepID=A0ABV8NLK8_9SPHI
MASYFPYYFYRGFDLKTLRFHAIYGVPLFLLLPYLVFFVIGYSLNKNLNAAIEYGSIIPFFYALILLWAIIKAIRIQYKEHRERNNFLEEVGVYFAVTPWASMPILSYFHASQLVEVLFTNTGFIIITIIFISTSIKAARKEYAELLELKMADKQSSPYFTENCSRFGLTKREIEIVQNIRQGHKNKAIAEGLHISEGTVKKHIENLFHKTGTNGRMELINKLVSKDNG